jgi:polyhydroxybutyrate depolymerase
LDHRFVCTKQKIIQLPDFCTIIPPVLRSASLFPNKFSVVMLSKSALYCWLWLFAVVAFAGCSKGDSTPETPVYRVSGELIIDGLTRTYTLVLPPDYYSSTDFSLVIAMHGGGGSAEQFESTSLLTNKANAAKFIVVYPEGVQSNGVLKARTWNAGSCCDYAVEKNINDVKYLTELINTLTAKYKINPKKIYATGHSNGGMMSYRLACELSGKIAAIAVSGCTMMVTQSCNPSHPVPVLHMHSYLDENVPYLGGVGVGPSKVYNHPVDSGLTVLSAINACGIKAKIVEDNAGYKLTQWSNCANNVIISWYMTKDGGHAWPGGLPGSAMGDTPSKVISANELLWAFFQQYQLP